MSIFRDHLEPATVERYALELRRLAFRWRLEDPTTHAVFRLRVAERFASVFAYGIRDVARALDVSPVPRARAAACRAIADRLIAERVRDRAAAVALAERLRSEVRS